MVRHPSKVLSVNRKFSKAKDNNDSNLTRSQIFRDSLALDDQTGMLIMI